MCAIKYGGRLILRTAAWDLSNCKPQTSCLNASKSRTLGSQGHRNSNDACVTKPLWCNNGQLRCLATTRPFPSNTGKKTRNQVAFKLHGWVIFERRHLNHCFPLFVTRAFICYEAVQSKQISSATRSIENAARGKMAFLWTERNDTNRTAGCDVHAPNTGTTEHNNVKSYKLTEAGTVQQTRGSWQQTSFGSVRTATWKWWRTGKWLFAVIFLKLLQKAVSVMIFFLFVEFFLEKKTSKFCFLGRFVRECLEFEFVRD